MRTDDGVFLIIAVRSEVCGTELRLHQVDQRTLPQFQWWGLEAGLLAGSFADAKTRRASGMPPFLDAGNLTGYVFQRLASHWHRHHQLGQPKSRGQVRIGARKWLHERANRDGFRTQSLGCHLVPTHRTRVRKFSSPREILRQANHA